MVFIHSFIHSIDLLMPSTTLVVAHTLNDVQHARIRLAETEQAYNNSNSNTSNSNNNNLDHTTSEGISLSSSLSNHFSQFPPTPATPTPTTTTTTTTTSVHGNPSSHRLDLSLLPVVTCQWVLDCHAEYTVRDFDNYLWRNGIFSNLTFFIHSFKQHAHSVRQCIEENDGEVTEDLEAAAYVVCPRTVTTDIYKDERAVSDRWLRKCRDEKRLVSRSEHVLFRPYPALLQGREVCLTGFGHDNKVMELYIR